MLNVHSDKARAHIGSGNVIKIAHSSEQKLGALRFYWRWNNSVNLANFVIKKERSLLTHCTLYAVVINFVQFLYE